MKKIASFTVNHLTLLPGVYVSRKDHIGAETVTTFDIRMTRPNYEPVMNTAEVHTIEHLGATFLRNHKEFSDRVVYFGPMGCRTGFYLLLAGDHESKDIIGLLKGRSSGCSSKGLRKLFRHESADGKLSCKKILRRSVVQYDRGSFTLPGIMYT